MQKQDRDWVEWMPWIGLALIVATTALFGLNFAYATGWTTPALMVALLALGAAVVVWYVRAFTFPVDEAKEPDSARRYRYQIFIFAYAFTLIAFVVVLLPAGLFNEIAKRPDAMVPFKLFYGCYDYPAGTVVATGRLGCAEADLKALKEREKDPTAPLPRQSERSHTLLLGVGGYTARHISSDPYFAVSGGLVLPVYMVIIALVGGAISLSRRIPEIQKRSEPNFPGTPTQTRLLLYEAREQVNFQIMQFVSAPFIAICAFLMIEPSSQTVAVALAFACGFFSESVLLMIRGVVDKIRPETPNAVAAESATVSGITVDAGGAPVAGARVSIPGVPASVCVPVTSGSDGRFVLHGVPKRKTMIDAASGTLAGQQAADLTGSDSADVTIVLTAPPPPSGAADDAEIAGRVVDAADVPVAGAVVSVDGGTQSTRSAAGRAGPVEITVS